MKHKAGLDGVFKLALGIPMFRGCQESLSLDRGRGSRQRGLKTKISKTSLRLCPQSTRESKDFQSHTETLHQGMKKAGEEGKV